MSASTWLIIAIILFTLAAALFIAAVIMFFVMNIPAIIGDLTGRTLAKGIQNIRNESAYANSKSAKAANRRNNPNRPFSIGNEYSDKGRSYTVSSIAHASRRLDRTGNTTRGAADGTSQKLNPPPTSNKFTDFSVKNNQENKYTENSDVNSLDNSVRYSRNNEYVQETSVLNNTNNEYTQATTVLNNADNQYTQATTVLNNADNQYTQATTILNNANNQYTQATTVLGNENTTPTSVLDSYYNEYTQGTTILSNDTDNANSTNHNEAYDSGLGSQSSNVPSGFRVVRRISVTHCNEVL